MIRINTFSGMAPRIGPSLLPDNHAQVANNAVMYSGELRPVTRSLRVADLDERAASIYCARNGDWMGWDVVTEAVEAPLMDDQFSRLYFTNENGAFVTSPSIWNTGSGNLPRVSYKLGQPAPAAAPTVSKSGTPGGDPEVRYYAYTRVSTWGEESPPSPLAEITAETGEQVLIADLVATASGYVPLGKYRIYRSATGSSGASLMFLAETTSTSYADTTPTSELSSPIETILYDPPPTGLRGIITLPNGALAGFVGREVWFSEPYLPHAWPEDYRIPVDSAVVAMGVVSVAVAVATAGHPYLLHGAHPSSYLPKKLPEFAPCLSGRGLVDTPMGVAWPSLEGLYGVTVDGASYVTLEQLRKKEWGIYYPSTMIGAVMDGGYLCLYEGDNGLLSGIRIDRDGTLTALDIEAIDAVRRGSDGRVYALSHDGLTVLDVGGHTTPDTLSWRSKVFRGHPRNMVAAKVDYLWAEPVIDSVEYAGGNEGDATLGGAPVSGLAIAIDSAMPMPPPLEPDVVLDVYADGELISRDRVTDIEPFLLPAGYLARDIEFLISANTTIREVALGESVEEVL